MGMLITNCLISWNVYGSTKAPPCRGFSYIEIWIIGAQFPILLAICEYGLVLYWKKIARKIEDQNRNQGPDLDDWIKKLILRWNQEVIYV